MAISSFDTNAGPLIAISDGQLELGAELFSGMSDSEVASSLARVGQENGPVPIGLNTFVVRVGSRNILIDSGGKAVMPQTGKLLDGLKEAGLTSDDIDTILLTHMHPDHIGGLANGENAVFPNAQLHLHEAEYAFWQNSEYREKAPEEAKAFFDLAQHVLRVYRDRTSTFGGEIEIVPGILTVPLPGHTPGHTGYQIGVGERGVLCWGDIVHVQAFQMPHPEAAVAFDVDRELAVKTRTATFERAASDRLRIAGMHLKHPGVGFVVRDGDGYWLEPATH